MNNNPIISVKEGKLRGIKKTANFSGAEYYSFYGIPYGEPPVKNLRFKDPVKVKPWKGIRDATTETYIGCSQLSFITRTVIGSEDCLYMHIYTPQLPSEMVPLKPVVVCIHPGSYKFGSAATWDFGSPNFIMHHDVVYVCINFRLHIFGFLNLNMKECSGNQCLKDIILGLQWIRENIHNFNGDPNNITLYGSSSGANTINIFMLSPAAKGLFHKAVMTSSILLVYTTYQDENETIAFQIARMLGFQGTDRNKLFKFLKRTSAEKLTAIQRQYESEQQHIAQVFPQSVFLPTVDSTSEIPVIPISPRKLIGSIYAVPTIFGICERESILGFTTKKQRMLTEKNYRTGYRQNQWTWMYDLNDDEMKMLNDEVEKFHLKDYPGRDPPLSVKVDMISDIAFNDIYDSLINPIAQQLSSSVYLYKYQFDTDMNDMKTTLSGLMREKLSGTYHGCDYSCWIYTCQKFTDENVHIIETYTKFITTFAKNGDPNYETSGVQWRPTTAGKPCYLCINTELQMVDGEFFQESVEFWKNIKKKFKKN